MSSNQTSHLNGNSQTVIETVNKHDPFLFINQRIVSEWRPIIGSVGFDLYSFYMSFANENNEFTARPSLNLIQTYLNYNRETVVAYNALLSYCELIFIEHPWTVMIVDGQEKRKKKSNRSNTYHLLNVQPVSTEKLVQIRQKITKLGQIHEKWQKSFLERIDNWRPLYTYYGRSQYKSTVKAIVPQQPSLFNNKMQEPEAFNSFTLSALDLVGVHDPHRTRLASQEPVHAWAIALYMDENNRREESKLGAGFMVSALSKNSFVPPAPYQEVASYLLNLTPEEWSSIESETQGFQPMWSEQYWRNSTLSPTAQEVCRKIATEVLWQLKELSNE